MKRAAVSSAAPALDGALQRLMSEVFRGNVEISAVRRLTGGTSHDSWAFDVSQDGAVTPLILRREFSSEQLDLDLKDEFELLSRLYANGFAVPKPIYAEPAGGALDSAFTILERLSGGDVRKQMAAGRVDPETLGVQLVQTQARMHQLDWRKALQGFWTAPDRCLALAEVERWEHIASECAIGPDPLLSAAFDFLSAKAPANDAIALVHGDFKANNIVMGAEGRLAVIDWELAHLGDPLEDLAWTMLWTTSHDLVGGMLDEARYVREYQAAIGKAVDMQRLEYWRVFALAKLASIFLKSMRLQGADRHMRPTHVMLGRAMPWIQRQLAQRLENNLTSGHFA